MKTYAKMALLLLLLVVVSATHITKTAAQNINNTSSNSTVTSSSSSSTTTSTSTSTSTSTVIPIIQPTVSVSPATQSVDIGATITLTATPGSQDSAGDTYEWYNTTSGSPVDTGQSGTTFTETAGATARTFMYDVVVTDPISSETGTSNPASVTVSSGPTVSISPSSQSEDVGQQIKLTATQGDSGSGGDTYEWYNTTSGAPVDTGHSGTTFTETAGATAGTFTYDVVATDSSHETATSVPASITVSAAPTVTVSPLLQSQTIGHSITIVATIGNRGAGTYTYQWYNGSLSDAIVSQKNISYIATADEVGTFSYLVVVTDPNNGTAVSNLAWVTVSVPPTTPTSSAGTSTISSTASTTTTTTTLSTTIPATATNQSGQKFLINYSYNVNSISPKAIPIPDANIILYLKSLASNSSVHITAVNLTSSILQTPGYKPIIVLNLNISAPVKLDANLTVEYQCSIPSNAITPYYNINSTWQSFNNYTVNSTTCTIRFSIPKDPIIGIFERQVNTTGTLQTVAKLPPQANTSTNPTANTVSKDTSKSEYPLAFIPLTSEAIGAIVVVVVLIAIFIYMSKPSIE